MDGQLCGAIVQKPAHMGRQQEAKRLSQLDLILAERRIRYLDVLLDSATYRFYVALRAIRAIRPDDHCTLLHARTSRASFPQKSFHLSIPSRGGPRKAPDV